MASSFVVVAYAILSGFARRPLVTFATPDEMGHYLRVTLPRAGWKYREQFGSVHALERRDLLLSVQSTFYRGTRVGELRISLLARPRRAA